MPTRTFTPAPARRSAAPAPRPPAARSTAAARVMPATGVPRFAAARVEAVSASATRGPTTAGAAPATERTAAGPRAALALERRQPPGTARAAFSTRRESVARTPVGRGDSPWEREAGRLASRAPQRPSAVRVDAPAAGRATPAHPGLGPSPPSPQETSATHHPLPPTIRNRLEAITGFDLGGIRIASGPAVERTADALQARAYTQFGRIHLGRGASPDDFSLLAHEVAHALQQTLPAVQLARLGLSPAPADTILRQPFGRSPFAERRRARNALLDPFALPFWSLPRSVRGALYWIGDEGLAIRLTRAVPEELNPSLWLLRQLEGVWRKAEREISSFAARQQIWNGIQALATQTDDPSLTAAARSLADQLPAFFGSRWTELQGIIAVTVRAAALGVRRWDGGLTSLAPPIAALLDDLAEDIGGAFEDFSSESWVHDALRTALGCPAHVRSGAEVIAWINGLHRGADEMIQTLARNAQHFVTAQFDTSGLGRLGALAPDARSIAADLRVVADIMSRPDGIITERKRLTALLPPAQKKLSDFERTIVPPAQSMKYAFNTFGTVLQGWGRAPVLEAFFANEFAWMDRLGAAFDPWISEQEPQLIVVAEESLEGIGHWTGLLAETAAEAELLEEEVPDFDAGWFSFVKRAWAALWNSKETIIKGLLKRVPLLRELTQAAPALWKKAQALFGRFVERIFKEGKILAPLWEFFLGVLELELPLEFVRDIASRAGSLLGKILRHPLQFLGNLARGISHGLHRFCSKLGEHLMSGLLEWLFGEFGLQPPITFGRIADALLTHLGLTLEFFCQRIAHHLNQKGHDIKPQVVEQRLRQAIKIGATAVRWIKYLLDGDYAAFWQEVRDHLSEFWVWVKDKATRLIVDTLKERLVDWLKTLLDPTGISQIIEVLKSIYDAVRTMIEHIEKMWAIVRSVFNAIREIAEGEIDRAASFVESAASKALGVIIAFGAKRFGLGSVVKAIKDGLAEAKRLVEKAMDRVIRMASAVWDWLVAQAEKALEWWKNRRAFTDDDGARRELYYNDKVDPQKAILYVSAPSAQGQVSVAATPLALAEYLKTLKQLAKTARERQLVTEIEQFAADINEVKRETDGSFSATRGAEIHVYFNEIALRLNEFAGEAAIPPATVRTPSTDNFYDEPHGVKMVAHPLSIDPGGNIGSKPVASATKWWNKLRGLGGGNRYIRGHLLNHHLHGPGTWENMIPIARTTNTEMEQIAEDKVKKAVIGQNRVVHYEVRMVFGSLPSGLTAPEQKLPSHIEMQAYELKYRRGKWEPNGVDVLKKKRLKNEVGA